MNKQERTIAAGAILTPTGWKNDAALIIEEDRIVRVAGASKKPDTTFENALICPGFIDIQVNGGGGVLLNDAPNLETIKIMGSAHAAFGTTAFLPTLITGTRQKIPQALASVREALLQPDLGVIGVHLEGPFLNSEKRGIHDADYIRSFTSEDLDAIEPSGTGIVLMTLAPEIVGVETIKNLAARGILIAAGHTAMDEKTAREALASGVTGFTHLFNAMPPMLSRAPGPVGVALNSAAWCGIIADGHHVSDTMLKIAIRAKRDGRIILVTDAMPPVGTGNTEFRLGDRLIKIKDGRCVDDKGTLAGSVLTMIGAVRHAVQNLDVSLEIALRMASTIPAEFLGLHDTIGSLKSNMRADFVVLSQDLEVLATYRGGQRIYAVT